MKTINTIKERNNKPNPFVDSHKFVGSHRSRAGFTLGELLVAVSMFIIIISVAMGTFIHSLQSERTVVSNTEMLSSINHSIEIMAREIRTGFSFEDTLKSELEFTNAERQRITYQYNSSDKSVERCVGSDCSPLTAEDVEVNNLQFLGERGDETDLPVRVTILMGVDWFQDAKLDFQTTVSARKIE